MTQKKAKKPWLIIIAMALAIVVGLFIDKDTRLIGIHFYAVFDIVGTLFLNALTLVVVPLVASSIITGVARIASESQFGRMGGKTFAFFLLTNFIAILIGVLIANIIKPGAGVTSSLTQIATPENLDIAKKGGFSSIILEIVPSNILNAFAKGNMLGLIFFSLLFGYAITQISKKSLLVHLQFWKGIFEAMIRIVHGIMLFLPIGVFCLTAKIFADAGIETLKPLANFAWTVILGLVIFSFGAIPLLLRFIAGVSFISYFRAISPAIVTAFSTSSSSATLPISLECMEEGVGVSNRICSLVIPLGTSLNLSGTAFYIALSGLFIAQVFGVQFSLIDQITYTFVALIVSFGVASIPSGGLVAILTVLRIMGLPLEGIGLILAFDRILDMFRTTTNLFSYTTCAILVAKTEGEEILVPKAK